MYVRQNHVKGPQKSEKHLSTTYIQQEREHLKQSAFLTFLIIWQVPSVSIEGFRCSPSDVHIKKGFRSAKEQ